MCRRIVELFGGHLWVESEVGRGSTFGFAIPSPARHAQVPRQEVANDDGPVIVVVEDDRRSLELISLYLEGRGVRVVSAQDGTQGLAAVRSHQPAAVVLDIRLPGIDGWRVLETLKADPVTASVASRGRDDVGRAPASDGARRVRVLDETRWARRGPRRAVPDRGVAAGVDGRQPRRLRPDEVDVMTETILVVEDNDKNLKLLRDVLQYAGYEVVAAGTGEEGVAMAIEHSPSLVLMDLQLPGMDGTEALHRLRASARTRSVPVIAVTAFAMREDHQRAVDAGFDGYLVKPISVTALPDQVRSFILPGGISP